MSEASRIESSFGPIRLAERPDIHEGDGLGTNLLSPHPHNDHAGSCSIYAGRPWRRDMPPTTSMFWQLLVRGTLRVGEMGDKRYMSAKDVTALP
jgi:hypothetical protein